jgi:hypothetical protein
MTRDRRYSPPAARSRPRLRPRRPPPPRYPGSARTASPAPSSPSKRQSSPSHPLPLSESLWRPSRRRPCLAAGCRPHFKGAKVSTAKTVLLAPFTGRSKNATIIRHKRPVPMSFAPMALARAASLPRCLVAAGESHTGDQASPWRVASLPCRSFLSGILPHPSHPCPLHFPLNQDLYYETALTASNEASFYGTIRLFQHSSALGPDFRAHPQRPPHGPWSGAPRLPPPDQLDRVPHL